MKIWVTAFAQALADCNPIATTLGFHQLIENVRENLFGLTKKRKKNQSLTAGLFKSLHHNSKRIEACEVSGRRPKGVFGVNTTNRDVKETNKRASLHVHGHAHGGVTPQLIADVVNVRETGPLYSVDGRTVLRTDQTLLDKAMEALESQLCAELPLEYHALGIAHKVLRCASGPGMPPQRISTRRDAAFHTPLPWARAEFDNDASYAKYVREEWWPEFEHHAYVVAMNRNSHKWKPHEDTCVTTEGSGKFGCRMCAPWGHNVERTRCIELCGFPGVAEAPKSDIDVRCPVCYPSEDKLDMPNGTEEEDKTRCLFYTAHELPRPHADAGDPEHRAFAVHLRRRLIPTSDDVAKVQVQEELSPASSLSPSPILPRPLGVCWPAPLFSPCSVFVSSRPGAVYKLGERGLGFYRDAADTVAIGTTESGTTGKWVENELAKLVTEAREHTDTSRAARKSRANTQSTHNTDEDPLDTQMQAWPFGRTVSPFDAQCTLRKLVDVNQKLGRLLARTEFTVLRKSIMELAYGSVSTGDRDAEVDAADPEAARRLIRAWANQETICLNGIVADFSKVLTGCTKGNAVPLTLGAGAASKSTSMYQIKYMGKNSTKLSVSVPVLIDALRHVRNYPSTADDRDQPSRVAKYFTQHVINHSAVELEATQAAALVLGIGSSGGSDHIEYHHAWDYVKVAVAACALRLPSTGGTGCFGYASEEEDSADDGTEPVDSRGYHGGAESSQAPALHTHSLEHSSCSTVVAGPDEPQVDLLQYFNAGGGDHHGFSCVYTTRTGVPVAVSDGLHYAYRDSRLFSFCAYEFGRAFSVRKMKPADKNWYELRVRLRGLFRVVALLLRSLRYVRVRRRATHILEPRSVAAMHTYDGRSWFLEWESVVLDERTALSVGRPCLRFVLRWPHLLFNSHIIVARAKWGVPALVGAPPPREPSANGMDTRARQTGRRTFARYMIANFVPWSAWWPPQLEFRDWEEHVQTLQDVLDASPSPTHSTQPGNGEARAMRQRYTASGRLYDIDNVVHGFRTRSQVTTMLAADRSRSRTLWNSRNTRPLPDGGDAASDPQQQAAKLLEEITKKAERLQGKKDIATRMHAVRDTEAWASKMREHLPSARLCERLAAGKRLCRLWTVAASPTGRTLVGMACDVKKIRKGLTEPLPALEVASLRSAIASQACQSSTSSVASAVPLSLDGPFAPISERDYESAMKYHRQADDAGQQIGTCPLNPEQRNGGRGFLRAAQLRAAHLRRGLSAAQIARDIRMEGHTSVTLVIGPGGSGKSFMVHELRKQMLATDCGHLLVTAYTGVAAAPFGGPTLLSLLNLNIVGKSATRVQSLSQGQRESARQKFFNECGVRVEDIGGIVIDESSFIELKTLGHVDNRLRQLTGAVDVFAGGIPLLLIGDCHQKAPPGGAHWYKALVDNALSGTILAEGQTSAACRGLQLLQAAPRIVLTRLMRVDADDPDAEAFTQVQLHMRRMDVEQPVPDALMRRLRAISTADLAEDEEWRFAPVGVLTHIERDTINIAQVEAFARAFDLPLVKWRIAMVDTVDDVGLRDRLYADEPNLFQYFVEGAPVYLTETIKSVRKLVNGSPAIMDSLAFVDNAVPLELSMVCAKGGFRIVELKEPPFAVNVRVGGTTDAPQLWHGVPLDDLSGLIESVIPNEQVIPLLVSSNAEDAELHGIVAAQANIAEKVKVKIFQFMLAFALTDFKLQGRTLPKLVINLCKRTKFPWMTLCCLYVLISRVRKFSSLRLLHYDTVGLNSAAIQTHDEQLYAWEQGYDGRGEWSDHLATNALRRVQQARRCVKEAGAAKRRDDAKAKAEDARARTKAATKCSRVTMSGIQKQVSNRSRTIRKCSRCGSTEHDVRRCNNHQLRALEAHQQYVQSTGLPWFDQLKDATMPAWWRSVVPDLTMHARVIDYWAEGSDSSKLVVCYLEQLGFEVEFDTSRRQNNMACPFVAARVATDLYTAGEHWRTCDVSRATDPEWIHAGNLALGRTALDEVNRGFMAAGEQVEELVGHFWHNDLPTEQLGHLSSTVPSWLHLPCAVSLDHFFTQLVKDLQQVKRHLDDVTARSNDGVVLPLRVRIPNTELSTSKGLHWFTVAYAIERTTALATRVQNGQVRSDGALPCTHHTMPQLSPISEGKQPNTEVAGVSASHKAVPRQVGGGADQIDDPMDVDMLLVPRQTGGGANQIDDPMDVDMLPNQKTASVCVSCTLAAGSGGRGHHVQYCHWPGDENGEGGDDGGGDLQGMTVDHTQRSTDAGSAEQRAADLTPAACNGLSRPLDRYAGFDKFYIANSSPIPYAIARVVAWNDHATRCMAGCAVACCVIEVTVFGFDAELDAAAGNLRQRDVRIYRTRLRLRGGGACDRGSGEANEVRCDDGASFLVHEEDGDNKQAIHCRNALTLARINPLPSDPHLIFDEEPHTYTCWGQLVTRSVTGIVACAFDSFDPVVCTNKYFDRWSSDPESEYFALIERVRAAGGDDKYAISCIHSEWRERGQEASRLGTVLHRYCEFDCNNSPVTPPAELQQELTQWFAWKRSTAVRESELCPFRTELTVAWRVGDTVVTAGQIDALFTCKHGYVYMVDFKRVASKHALDPRELGFGGRTGIGSVAHVPDTQYQRYSLQQSLYCVMLKQTHGLDVEDRMYLLRMHADRDSYQIVQCRDLRREAEVLLQQAYTQVLVMEQAKAEQTQRVHGEVIDAGTVSQVLGVQGNSEGTCNTQAVNGMRSVDREKREGEARELADEECEKAVIRRRLRQMELNKVLFKVKGDKRFPHAMAALISTNTPATCMMLGMRGARHIIDVTMFSSDEALLLAVGIPLRELEIDDCHVRSVHIGAPRVRGQG